MTIMKTSDDSTHAAGGLLLRGGRMTKWKGRVVSMSPHIGALSAGISLSAFAVSMALGSGLLLAPMASAQTVALTGTNNTTTQTATGAPLVVTTDPNYKVETTTGGGLVLTGTNGITFSDLNNSTIKGATTGVSANNSGGTLSVTVSGIVSGGTGAGIATESNAGGTVTIDLLSGSSVSSTSGVAISAEPRSPTAPKAAAAAK